MASLTLDWLHVVVLLGAVQGLFLAGALVTKRRNRTANRLLAAAMLVFSLGLATSVYHAAGLESQFPHFFGVGYPLPFLYGPLVYLYAVTASDRDRHLRRSDLLHLVPFLAVVIAGLPIYMMSGAEKLAFQAQLAAGHAPLLITVADPLKFVSGITYAAVTIFFVRRHRERIKESYSSTERVNLGFVVWLCLAAAGIWLLATVMNVVSSAGIMNVARSDDYVALAVAVLVGGIGYRGLRQPEIFRFETAEWAIPVKPAGTAALAGAAASAAPTTPSIEGASPAIGGADEGPRYERSGLSNREAIRLKESLVGVMERDQPWKNSELTLADLAQRLDTTPHKLSEVLNTELRETFYDFVNGYRVREVQRRIKSGEGKALKILSLALDAGFASKSTFNEVFKKHVGRTPSQYGAAAVSD